MTEKLTLTELQLVIRDSLYAALPGMYWVTAEISEMKENYAGHCYLELVEKQPDDRNIRARARAVMWSNRYRFLKSFFEDVTGESLREGLKILVRIKIEYHEIYGLSLVISDIDPAFTIGDLAVKRQMIIKKLEEEGVLNMNRELDFPLIPQRIAIISSRNAAGFSDFLKHLKENIFGYAFYTFLYEAAMQGNETEQGIISAFDRIAASIELFDIVVIIRGGGSQTDLSWFDNYSIAYYITQFPLPVLTGIGHEKDLSVTDIVAFRALKTPTAVADFIIESINSTENHIIETGSDIINKTRTIVQEYRRKVDSYKTKLAPLAKIMISEIREKLSGIIIEMINTGKDYILKAGLIPANHKSRLASSAKALPVRRHSELTHLKENLAKMSLGSVNRLNIKLYGLLNSLKILDPVNVLKRGYTITSMNGRILKSGKAIRNDNEIETKFSDASVRSRVFGKDKRQKEKDKS